MDLSIFTTPEAWISLVTLIFLEIVLGVDNIVFISITSSRLPAEKQHRRGSRHGNSRCCYRAIHDFAQRAVYRGRNLYLYAQRGQRS